MADQLVAIIADKLDERATAVWGEIPQLIRGPVSFRRGAHATCPVSDVYIVLGGVYNSQAHYRLEKSRSQNGAYDYIHRLSGYHLNPFTFRRMMEDALVDVLTALKHEGKILTNIEVDATISVTPTNDALELTCCVNGARAPAWMLRFIAAIEGVGAAPHAASLSPSASLSQRWLIVPPPRLRGPYVSTWDVALLSDPERVLVCTLYEARYRDWGDGEIDFDRLLNRFAGQERVGALGERFAGLLRRVAERIAQHHAEDGIPIDQIETLVCQINRSINDVDLGSRVRSIDEAISQHFPWLERDADTCEDEVARQPVVECVTRQEAKPQMQMANGASRNRERQEPKSRAANGISRQEANGFGPKRQSGKKGNKNDDERARKRYLGVVSICLVLVVVGLVFVIAWFEDTDFMNLMHATKLMGVLTDERKEF